MEIKFLKKIPTHLDGVELLYEIDNKNVYLKVSGTALSFYDLYNLPDDELGEVFVPVMIDVYIQLKDQGAEMREVCIDSEGTKVKGKIIYVREDIEKFLKNRKYRIK